VSQHALSNRVHNGAAHRLFRGAYVFGAAPPTFAERARAALLVSPPGTVLGFDSAAVLHGFGIVETSTIHIVVPPGVAPPQRAGIRVHQSTIPFESVTRCGMPCTPPARTAIDLVRTLPRIDALPVLDAALFARACTGVDLSHAVDAIDRLAGARQARDLVPLADGRAQCRQETQLRLILFDAGFTGFIPQLLVTDGRVRHHLDLGDPELRVGAEYDGRSHADPARLGPDRERHNFLSDMGWRMRYFTGFAIYRRPARVIATVRRAAQSPS
jgi:hypothetical protein